MYQFSTLAKIIEVAGLSAIYAIPSLTKSGFAYHSAEAKLEVKGGKILDQGGRCDAPSVTLSAKATST